MSTLRVSCCFFYCDQPGAGCHVSFFVTARCSLLCVQSPACRRGDLPKIDGYYYPPVSGLHPSISGRVGTVTYVKIGCKFETVASQLEAEASICSINIEQTTRHITVHNVYYPECDGEGEWPGGRGF